MAIAVLHNIAMMRHTPAPPADPNDPDDIDDADYDQPDAGGGAADVEGQTLRNDLIRSRFT